MLGELASCMPSRDVSRMMYMAEVSAAGIGPTAHARADGTPAVGAGAAAATATTERRDSRSQGSCCGSAACLFGLSCCFEAGTNGVMTGPGCGSRASQAMGEAAAPPTGAPGGTTSRSSWSIASLDVSIGSGQLRMGGGGSSGVSQRAGVPGIGTSVYRFVGAAVKQESSKAGPR